MTWNYRVMKYKGVAEWDNQYGVHEVYYDEKGIPNGWTRDPIVVAGTVSELFDKLLIILKSVIKSRDKILPYEKEEEDGNTSKDEE